jgi:protein dithiol oxidoreductase (disulfide-forming)
VSPASFAASRLCAFAVFAGVLVALAGPTDSVGQQFQLRPNYEYRLIPPRPPATGERIEVIEFFWYGCPYCNQLQSALESWLQRKPADVELRRIPAIFRESWIPHARLFYTLEALGELGRLHQTVYRTHHIEHENLNSAERSVDWAVRHGIDRTAWLATYNSPEVDQKVRQAIADTRLYSVQGTPSLVVDGRYLTSTGMTETVSGVIPILDELIRLAREERTPGK